MSSSRLVALWMMAVSCLIFQSFPALDARVHNLDEVLRAYRCIERDVLEAQAKPPADILDGNVAWFGGFQDCIFKDVETFGPAVNDNNNDRSQQQGQRGGRNGQNNQGGNRQGGGGGGRQQNNWSGSNQGLQNGNRGNNQGGGSWNGGSGQGGGGANQGGGGGNVGRRVFANMLNRNNYGSFVDASREYGEVVGRQIEVTTKNNNTYGGIFVGYDNESSVLSLVDVHALRSQFPSLPELNATQSNSTSTEKHSPSRSWMI